MKEQLIISGTPERNHAAAALLDREGVAYDRMQEPSRSYSYRNPATFGKPRAYATQEMAAELSACAGDLDYARKQGLIGDLGEKRYYQQYSQYRQMFSSGQALSHLDRIITRDDSVRQFAQPTATDVHIDAILTEISVKYQNAMWIGPLISPRVMVDKRSDLYFVYDFANLRRDAGTRPPGAGYSRSGYKVTTKQYQVIQYAIEHTIPDEIAKNADTPLDADTDGVMYATDVVDLEYELQAATSVTTSGNWTTTTTLSGVNQWSDYANSNPLEDIQTGRETVLGQVAVLPNTAQMSFRVYRKLALHPDLLDRIKYTGSSEKPAMVTPRMMAELFEVDQILVGTAIYVTSKEGQAVTLGYVWPNDFWLGYVSPTAAIRRPTSLYTFTMGRQAQQYRYEPHREDVVRVWEDFQVQAVSAGAGYLIINASA